MLYYSYIKTLHHSSSGKDTRLSRGRSGVRIPYGALPFVNGRYPLGIGIYFLSSYLLNIELLRTVSRTVLAGLGELVTITGASPV